MTVHTRSGRETRPRLAEGLFARLPGLAPAMDEGHVADLLGREVWGHDGVGRVSVGKLWLRDDGTCTLRYRFLRPDASPAPGAEVLVLAGVNDVGLELHPFPRDPALPTLALAVDPVRTRGLLSHGPCAPLPSVEVVHYPREGACVLRYDVPAEPPGTTRQHHPTFYGKVYGDTAGSVTHRFLSALSAGHTGSRPVDSTRFPTPVAYASSLRTLVTEALPGAPLVPGLLRAVLAAGTGDDRRRQVRALRTAVRACGRALGDLHRCDVPAAPLHTAAAELVGLRRELDVVAPVWPRAAARVHRHLERLHVDASSPADRVLSHGDFTPSQVLLGPGAHGVVDLDTLCWADPALDLGRFLAHLGLLAARTGGDRAGPLVEELAVDLLAGHRETSTPGRHSTPSPRRIAYYRTASLARSALHACRQLKDDRLDVAMSLLDSAPDPPRSVGP